MTLLWCKNKCRQWIRKILADHKKIACIVNFFRYKNDPNYIESFLKINKDPNAIEIRNYGPNNTDKNIFFIEIQGEMGIGAFLRQTLHALYEADRLGFVPVVKYHESCPCKAVEPIHGTNNPFEYYFFPVSGISLDEVYQSQRVFLFRYAHLYRIEEYFGNLNPTLVAGYRINDDYMMQMAQITKKYIHLQQDTEIYINNGLLKLFGNNMIGNRVLAIHIRGTDYALKWENHPKMLMPTDYFSVIDSLLDRSFDMLFLATDDCSRLEAFKERYGSRLLYYDDTFRGSGSVNIAYERQFGENDGYKNGLEALRDMYSIAACDGFIGGLSQIAIMAQIIRLSKGEDFKYLKVLDKGIH